MDDCRDDRFVFRIDVADPIKETTKDAIRHSMKKGSR